MKQYKIGQWYRLEANHLRRPWYLKLLSEDNEGYLGEYIDNYNYYGNKGRFEKSYNYKLTEINLEEIQDYLPAEHIDKYVKKEIKMKRFKNKLAVKGSKSLLKAFKEELISLGYKWIDYSIEDCDYIIVNTVNKGEAYYNQTHGKADIKLFLPQDWNQALELAVEVEEEIPEYIEVIRSGGNNTIHPKHQKSVINGIYKVLYFSKAGTESKWDCYVCEGGYVIYPNYCKPSTKEAYEEQNKPKFKEGDWLYGKSDYSEFIFKFKSYDNLRDRFTTDEYYQIHHNRELSTGSSNNWASLSKVRLATDEEVKRILIKVAEIKYPIGTRIKPRNLNIMMGSPKSVKVTKNDFSFAINPYQIWVSSEQWNSIIYKNGKWAEIIEDPKLVINGYEVVKIDDYTIKVGCKEFLVSEIRILINLLSKYGGTYVHKDNTKWTVDDLNKILSVFD